LGLAVTAARGALPYGLFFLSGATSLVFELVWLRGFAILLGSTLYAMSCVLTAFTLGLALGSALANRFVKRFARRSPGFYIAAYGGLELVIGVSGLLLTLALFRGQGALLELLAGVASDSLGATLASHFALSFSLMLLPTTGMGATLPVLCMGLERDRDTPSLYSFNTFGAAAGSLIASFVLVYNYGCIGSAVIVGALNAAICAAALATAHRMSSGSDTGRAPAEVEEASAAREADDAWSPLSCLGLALFSGYAFFSYELVWNRILGLILGNRIYVTSITLFLVLFCLGLGARLSQTLRLRARPRNLLLGCYGTAALSALIAAQVHVAVLQSPQTVAMTATFVGLLICLPAIAMGVVLPLLLASPVRGMVRGVHVGRLYAANLVGSVLGSLLTGYLLIGLLGSGRLLLVNAGLLLGALWAFAGPVRSWGRLGGGLIAALSLCLCVVLALRWSTPVSVAPPQQRIVLEEDQHGIFSIERLKGGYLRVRNNATDLVFHYGRPQTQYVQESQAHFPLLVAPRFRTVAVIGSGYGITAGTFGRYPVERVDAVEILPLLIKHADHFRRGSYDYLRNPRVRVHIADGRHFLVMAKGPYDIISINVSDPYLPGSSSLFSTEFYRMVKQKLQPGGIVCQHIFGPDAVSLYHGFKAHFEYVRAVPAYGNGVSLLGSDAPIELRNLHLLEDITLPAMPQERDISPAEYVRRLLAAGDRLVASLSRRPPVFINSDVFPHLEFRRSERVDLFFSNE
jgi:predicted membrane-bound spermidine synthase